MAVTVEFPNVKEGEVDYLPPSNVPAEMLKQPETRQPLNDYVDEREMLRPPPKGIEVPYPEPGNKMLEFRRNYPQYADLEDHEVAQNLHKTFYPDMPKEEFEARSGLFLSQNKQGEIGPGIVPSFFIDAWDDIKKFMGTGDEKAAFRVAAALAMGGTGFSQKNAVGAFGGKPPGNISLFQGKALENRTANSNPTVPGLTDKIMSQLESALVEADQLAKASGKPIDLHEHRKMQEFARDLQKTIQDNAREANRPREIPTKPQEPQVNNKRISGGKEEPLSTKNKEWIKTFASEGYTQEEIASTLTRYYTNPGIEVNKKQVADFMKESSIKAGADQTSERITAELTKLDVSILGQKRTQAEIIDAMQKKFPDLTATAIVNRLDRIRAKQRNDQIDIEKFHTEGPKPGTRMNESTGLEQGIISKAEGQGELDFFAHEFKVHPVPTAEGAKREFLAAEALHHKAGVALKKGIPDATEEHVRQLGIYKDLSKRLEDTMKHIEKEEKRDKMFGGPPIRESLSGRVQFLLDEIAKIKEKIFTPKLET